MKKYGFTDETVERDGVVLHRIVALRGFGDVEKGDLGGFVESEANLSHDDSCWVSGDARVYDDARVFGDAWVYDDARVFGNARVFGDAWVYDDARVCGNAQVSDNAWVFGNAD